MWFIPITVDFPSVAPDFSSVIQIKSGFSNMVYPDLQAIADERVTYPSLHRTVTPDFLNVVYLFFVVCWLLHKNVSFIPVCIEVVSIVLHQI